MTLKTPVDDSSTSHRALSLSSSDCGLIKKASYLFLRRNTHESFAGWAGLAGMVDQQRERERGAATGLGNGQ